MIRFENITKSYGDNRVIADLNFEIAKGEFFVLIGPSGSGKTTTLKMINRLITPSQGDIYLNDKNGKEYAINPYQVLQKLENKKRTLTF